MGRPEDYFTRTPDDAASYEAWRSAGDYEDDDGRPCRYRVRRPRCTCGPTSESPCDYCSGAYDPEPVPCPKCDGTREVCADCDESFPHCLREGHSSDPVECDRCDGTGEVLESWDD